MVNFTFRTLYHQKKTKIYNELIRVKYSTQFGTCPRNAKFNRNQFGDSDMKHVDGKTYYQRANGRNIGRVVPTWHQRSF
jgi:hypothetical protein